MSVTDLPPIVPHNNEPFKPSTAVETLVYTSGKIAGQLAAKALTEHIRASEDRLTGMLNKDAWESKVKERIAKEEPFAVLYFDLTNFKKINDEINHNTGDIVLGDVAQILQNTFRTTDTHNPDLISKGEFHQLSDDENNTGRLGGDELAVFIDVSTARHQTDLPVEERAQRAISRVRSAIDEYLDRHPEYKELGFDVAMGCVVWDGQVPVTVEDLLLNVEENMKANKNSQHAENGKYR